jgi:hypothetical protein
VDVEPPPVIICSGAFTATRYPKWLRTTGANLVVDRGRVIASTRG